MTVMTSLEDTHAPTTWREWKQQTRVQTKMDGEEVGMGWTGAPSFAMRGGKMSPAQWKKTFGKGAVPHGMVHHKKRVDPRDFIYIPGGHVKAGEDGSAAGGEDGVEDGREDGGGDGGGDGCASVVEGDLVTPLVGAGCTLGRCSTPSGRGHSKAVAEDGRSTRPK
jgi:hypothetical protein